MTTTSKSAMSVAARALPESRLQRDCQLSTKWVHRPEAKITLKEGSKVVASQTSYLEGREGTEQVSRFCSMRARRASKPWKRPSSRFRTRRIRATTA
jgi:hypothetical protein